ncbi:MAG: hypothetical protein AAB116_00775 [Candidatus Poribacteria bacterium]
MWTVEILRDLILLILDKLKNGIPAITSDFGGVLAETGAICFESVNHKNGVELNVSVSSEDGSFDVKCPVFWQDVTDQMRSCYGDLEFTTEHGAYGVAILLILSLTDYTVIERSRKGTGFDYWLGRKDDVLFQKSARLEVSGIRNGDIDAIRAKVRARVKTKLNQVRRSDELGLPAFIVVVEFSNPLSQVVQR